MPLVFVLFNLGDLAGRAAAGIGPWAARPPPSLALLAYAGLRVVPAAALLLCNVVTPRPWRLPVVLRCGAHKGFTYGSSCRRPLAVTLALSQRPHHAAEAHAACTVHHDTGAHTRCTPGRRSTGWPAALVLALGLSNGHLASLVCMHAPALLPPAARARAGTVLAFAITSGITLGSVNPAPYLVQPCHWLASLGCMCSVGLHCMPLCGNCDEISSTDGAAAASSTLVASECTSICCIVLQSQPSAVLSSFRRGRPWTAVDHCMMQILALLLNVALQQ